METPNSSTSSAGSSLFARVQEARLAYETQEHNARRDWYTWTFWNSLVSEYPYSNSFDQEDPEWQNPGAPLRFPLPG